MARSKEPKADPTPPEAGSPGTSPEPQPSAPPSPDLPPEPTPDIEELQTQLAELERYRTDYGRSQNQIGELRQKIEERDQQLAQYQTAYQQMLAQQQPQQNQYYDPNAAPPPGLNREDVRREVLAANQEFYNNIRREQTEAYARYINGLNEAKQQPIFKNEKVRQRFEAAMADPMTQQQVMGGQRSAVDVLHKASLDFLSHDVLPQFQRPGSTLPKPQHSEGGVGHTPIPASDDEEMEARHKAAAERQRSGNADEYTDLVDSTLAMGAAKKKQ